jgi:predicted ArsR family transcriptional regulator
MGQRERSDDGRYTETVTPERVRAALAATADPVATASDVADQLGCTSEAARVKLVRLREEGAVDRRKVGSSAVVWWPADGGSPIEAAAAGDDRSAVEERDAEDIIANLEAFDAEGEPPASPLPSAEAVRDDYHAHRHRENLERLARDREGE